MRAGKQCRERWHNHLRPDIKRGPWTEEEERLLIAAHESLGNRWADIAANIPGRTENAVKNHWNATNRRRDVPVRQNGSSLVLREYLLRKALGDDDAVVVTDAPADLTRHIQTNALGTTKTDVMWQARRDGREVAATRPSLSLHRPFPVAPETFYRFNEHEDDDDNGRTLGSSPWFNPRGTLADATTTATITAPSTRSRADTGSRNGSLRSVPTLAAPTKKTSSALSSLGPRLPRLPRFSIRRSSRPPRARTALSARPGRCTAPRTPPTTSSWPSS